MRYKAINTYLSTKKLKFRVEKYFRYITHTEKNVYVWSRVPFYKQMWTDAARSLNAEISELADGIWEVGYGTKKTRISIFLVQLDDPVTLNLAGNKPFCYSILQKNGLTVPTYRIFERNTVWKMKDFIEEHGGLFVIKPASGTGAGVGVTTHIRSYRDCLDATAMALMYCKDVIIERLVPGECYRILVLDGKILHASRRNGLRIRGDGKSTVAELTEKDNSRQAGISANSIRTPVGFGDPDVTATLEAQGLKQGSIPGDGQEVLVKSNGTASKEHVEVRTVYNENATHLICDDIRNQAVQAANILGIRLAGVDVITLDPTVGLKEGRGVINEVNTTPGLHHHYNLSGSDTKSVATDVLRCLLGIPN